MFGLSFWEIVVTAVVALLVFGPDKLPELARQSGKFLGQFRKTSDHYRREFYNAVYSPSEEINRLREAARRELLTLPTHEQENTQSKAPPLAKSPASTASSTTSSPEQLGTSRADSGQEDTGSDGDDALGPELHPQEAPSRTDLTKKTPEERS